MCTGLFLYDRFKKQRTHKSKTEGTKRTTTKKKKKDATSKMKREKHTQKQNMNNFN